MYCTPLFLPGLCLSPSLPTLYLFIYLFKAVIIIVVVITLSSSSSTSSPSCGFFLFPPVIKIFLSQSTACGGEFLLWFSCKVMYVMCFWRVFCSFCSSRSDLAVLTHISPMGLVYKTPSKCVVQGPYFSTFGLEKEYVIATVVLHLLFQLNLVSSFKMQMQWAPFCS